MPHRAHEALLLSVALLGLAARVTPSAHAEPLKGSSSLAFLQVTRGSGGAQARFRWPSREEFAAVERGGVRVVRVVRGTFTGTADGGTGVHAPGVLLALWPTEEGFELELIDAPKRHRYEVQSAARSAKRWRLVEGSLEAPAPGRLRFESGDRRLTLAADHVSPDVPITAEALIPWTYATALLRSDPPIDEEFTPPMGLCSMDDSPQRAARSYADACYQRGRLGCFLQLQVRIMGDHFARTAWSSYGEAAHGTEAERLEDAGIEVERFLTGLILQFASAVEREELGEGRLSRALFESKHSRDIERVLVAMAENPALDEYNRIRATRTLAFLWLRAQGEARDLEALRTRLAATSLSEIARGWAQAIGRED